MLLNDLNGPWIGDLRWKTNRRRIYSTYLMGCVHVKHSVFPLMITWGKRDLLILDSEEWPPFLSIAYNRKLKMCCQTCIHHQGCVYWWCMIFWIVCVCCKAETTVIPTPGSMLSIVSGLTRLLSPHLVSSCLTPLVQVETLIIDCIFPLPSPVHSPQRLPTYRALTEQCCSRRALKDRLDCLVILIPHFLVYAFLFCST